MFVAIDPSIRSCGVAIFSYNSTLMAAGTVTHTEYAEWDSIQARIQEIARRIGQFVIDHVSPIMPVELLVTEWPQAYRPGKSKGDPNDLFALCAIPFACSGVTKPVIAYTPKEWAGQIPKATTKGKADSSPRAKRIRSRLTAEELKHWPSGQHDAIDAVGLGLFHVGRLNPVRKFPGAKSCQP